LPVQNSETAQQTSTWEIVSSEPHFESDHLTVATDLVRTPTRPEPRSWIVARRKPAVVVAPLTAEGKFVLIRQERIPIQSAIWEMPAGQVDELCDAGSFRDVALRELREETGYELAPGGELVPLGDFVSSPGFTDERAFLFLARPVHRSANGHEHSEFEAILDCREFDLPTLRAMIADGEIRDANTLAVYARLIAMDLLPR
jgi:ADP-ribose pyrophosphatase